MKMPRMLISHSFQALRFAGASMPSQQPGAN